MLKIEKSVGIAICHETHRSAISAILGPPARCSKNSRPQADLRFQPLGLCGRATAPGLRRHHPTRRAISNRLHARVGHEEGPQISDPRAPESEAISSPTKIGGTSSGPPNKNAGFHGNNVVPEFGPAPYQPLLPYSKLPVADLADICDWNCWPRGRPFFSTMIPR